MDESSKYLHYIVFFAIIVMSLINLGNFEIQSWDESLYVWRAHSIIDSGNYLDQTNESLSGLYSSTSPPFTIWGINLFINIFGTSEFTLRLFSILCSIISSILIYNIATFFIPKNWAVLSPILLSSALVWNNFARQAMTEIPLNMFFILCFYILCKIYFTNNSKNIITYSLLFSLSFASALLTKITISLFPILFILLFQFSNELKEKKYWLTIAGVLGILIALPWYIFMAKTYNFEFINALFPQHIYTSVEGNSREFGIFYYINQLIISLPILFMLIFIPKIIKNNINNQKRDYKSNFLLIYSTFWFLSFFVIFSISVTKNPHYATYLIPPLVLILVKVLSEIPKLNLSKLENILIFILTFLFFSWSNFSSFRLAVKSINFTHLSIFIYIIFALILILSLLILLTKRSIISKISKYFSSYIFISILSIILFSKTVYNNIFLDPKINFTATASINYLQKLDLDSFIYLYNKTNDGDSLFPQFKWYLKAEKYNPNITAISYSNHNIGINEANILNTLQDKYLVCNLDNGISYLHSNILKHLKNRRLLASYGNYIIFSNSYK